MRNDCNRKSFKTNWNRTIRTNVIWTGRRSWLYILEYEDYELLRIETVKEAYIAFIEIAGLWKNVSDLFYQAGEKEDIKYINQASEILVDLSERERITMEKLKIACTHNSDL